MTEPGLQPNSVFILEHDDRYYDMGDTFVRGVYLSREQAESDIDFEHGDHNVWNREKHNVSCCGVTEYILGVDTLREKYVQLTPR